MLKLGMGLHTYRNKVTVNPLINDAIRRALADGAEIILTKQQIENQLPDNYSDSSFLYIPFARKAGKSYSLIGPDLTIDRNSNAVEVNSSLLLNEVSLNVPRIEFDEIGPIGHLIEEQTTNVFPQGKDLSGTYSNITNATVTLNQAISPSGNLDATLLSGSTSWIFRDAITGTNTGTWTVSVWVKAVTEGINNTFRLSVSGNNLSSDLTATNEWQRFEYTVTNGGATACGLIRASSGNPCELYVWGLVVEDNTKATSTILSLASSTTRIVDLASTSLPTLTQYVLLFEFDRSISAPLPAGTSNFFDKSDSANTKGRINLSTSNSIAYYSVATAYLPFVSLAGITRGRYVLRGNSGTVNQYFNGTAYGSGVNPDDELNSLFIRGILNANIRKIQILPLLSEAECLQLSQI